MREVRPSFAASGKAERPLDKPADSSLVACRRFHHATAGWQHLAKRLTAQLARERENLLLARGSTVKRAVTKLRQSSSPGWDVLKSLERRRVNCLRASHRVSQSAIRAVEFFGLGRLLATRET